MVTGERLTYSEIKAYSDLTGANIQPGEVAIIRKLDLIFWSVKNER